jgi:hypothetical protein
VRRAAVAALLVALAFVVPDTVNGHGTFPINSNAWVSVTYKPASSPTAGAVATIVEDATGIIARGAARGFKGTPLFTNVDATGHASFHFCWAKVLSQGWRNHRTRYAWNGEFWFGDDNFPCDQSGDGEFAWLSISVVDNATFRYHGDSEYEGA